MTLPVDAVSLGGLPLQLNPNARDYTGIREEALRLVQQLTPEWTDFSPSDPGVALLESVSGIAAMLHYAIDRAQNEGYLLTAQQRVTVSNILSLIGYTMGLPVAAVVPLTVITTGAVFLPKGFTVSTVDASISFEVSSDVTIPAAGTWNAEDFSGLFALEGVEQQETLGSSTGAQDQVFAISESRVCASPLSAVAVAVSVAGVPWSYRASFVYSEPNDQVYTYYTDSAGRVVVAFGDGVAGAIPPLGASITASYRVASGAAGNSVGISALVRNTSVPNLVSIRNLVQPSSGADAETITHAKKYGPRSLRTLDRAVTLEDYETLAAQVSGVAGARAFRTAPLEVTLYVTASGGNPVPTGEWFPRLGAGSGLLGVVGRYLEERKVAPALRIYPVREVRPILRGSVQLQPGALRVETARLIDASLRQLYARAVTAAQPLLPLSDVVSLLDATRGVSFVNVQQFFFVPLIEKDFGGYMLPHDDVTFGVYEPSSSLDAQKLTFVFLTSTTFRVRVGTSWARNDNNTAPKIYTLGEVAWLYRFATTDFGIQRTSLLSFSLVGTATRGLTLHARVRPDLGNLVFEAYEVPVPTLATEAGRVVIDPEELSLSYGGGVG